jgi:hypothetical protein
MAMLNNTAKELWLKLLFSDNKQFGANSTEIKE